MTDGSNPDLGFRAKLDELTNFNPATHVVNDELKPVRKISRLIERFLNFLKENFPSLFGRVTAIQPRYDSHNVLEAFDVFITEYDGELRGQSGQTILKLQDTFHAFIKQHYPGEESANRPNEFLQKQDEIRKKMGDISLSVLYKESREMSAEAALGKRRPSNPSLPKINQLDLVTSKFQEKLKAIDSFKLSQANPAEIEAWLNVCNSLSKGELERMEIHHPDIHAKMVSDLQTFSEDSI